MPRAAHDWEGLVAEWVVMKRKTPALTQAEFFRQKGISPSLGNRRIGARLVAVWQQVRDKATQEIIAKTGTDLAEEVERILRVGKSALAVGARNILPKVADDGSELPPPLQPTSFIESLALMREGNRTIQTAVEILSGGEPLKATKAEEVVIDFMPPVLPTPPPSVALPPPKPVADPKGGGGDKGNGS